MYSLANRRILGSSISLEVGVVYSDYLLFWAPPLLLVWGGKDCLSSCLWSKIITLLVCPESAPIQVIYYWVHNLTVLPWLPISGSKGQIGIFLDLLKTRIYRESPCSPLSSSSPVSPGLFSLFQHQKANQYVQKIKKFPIWKQNASVLHLQYSPWGEWFSSAHSLFVWGREASALPLHRREGKGSSFF